MSLNHILLCCHWGGVGAGPHTSPPLKRRSPKKFGSSGGSFLPTGATPVPQSPPYSTATDPEPINSALHVLSCGYEWGRGKMRA